MPRVTLRGSAIALAVAVAALVFCEAAIRLSGLVEFPLYDADSTIGYIPRPSQRGAFLHRNDWVFNELSMGTERPFKPDPERDILLIGDSIVLGGNPFAQRDKLGPLLESLTGRRVWPISAGSWALQNEMTYLGLHPQVARSVRTVVLVSNSEDFDLPSHWECPLTHPRERPAIAITYVLRKYFISGSCQEGTPALFVPVKDAQRLAEHFVAASTNEVVFVEYPKHTEFMNRPSAPESLRTFAQRLGPAVKTIDVAADARWAGQTYVDSIHPTSFQLLAKIISEQLPRLAPTN